MPVTLACPKTSVEESFRAGRAGANASRATNAQRINNRIKSSMRMRRWFWSTLSFTNFIAAHVTVLNLRRLSR